MRRTNLTVVIVGILLCGAASAQPMRNTLLQRLQGAPEQQAEAVQLLPRYGVSVLSDVLPFLDREDGVVRYAADDVAWAIVNQAQAPGRQGEAEEAAQILLESLAGEPSDWTRRRLLAYLAVGAPEGVDLAPVGRMLGTDEWGEKARTTLERINTTEARKELVGALDPANPELAANLLDALAQLQAPDTLAAAVPMLGHGHAPVRAAAARAVGWSGDPSLLGPLREVVDRATPDTEFEAKDALLRYVDALAERGGNWQLAMHTLVGLLVEMEGVLLDSTVAMLGRYGDESVIEPILTAVQAGTLRNRQAAAMAIGSIKGPGADVEIARLYPGLPEDMRLPMIAMMGQRGAPSLVSLVASEAETSDGFTRHVALRALARSGSADALPVLVTAAESDAPAIAETATAGLWQLAGALQATGGTEPAGVAYAHLYRLTDGDERALAGVTACPSTQAFDILLAADGGLQLAELPQGARVAMASALLNAGRREAAVETVEGILVQPLVGQPVNDLLGGLGAAAWELDVPRRLGFVTRWHVVGTFPFGGPGSGLDDVNVGEPNVDLGAQYAVADGTAAWQEVGPALSVDLSGQYGMLSNVVAYAYAEVLSDAARDVVLRMSSDDGIKVWLNGEVVHNNDVDRGAAIDQDSAPARLAAGVNRILVKCSQGAGGWGFGLRITTPEGMGVLATQPE